MYLIIVFHTQHTQKFYVIFPEPWKFSSPKMIDKGLKKEENNSPL